MAIASAPGNVIRALRADAIGIALQIVCMRLIIEAIHCARMNYAEMCHQRKRTRGPVR